MREAIDRGVPLEDVKPGNRITGELRKLVLDGASEKSAESKPLMQKLKQAVGG